MSRSRNWLTAGICISLVIILSCLTLRSDACSCQLSHPQMHYCDAHYAVVARIKTVKQDEYYTYYGVKILKQFKMSEKASFAFSKKNPEIISPRYESVCGVDLQKNQVYMLAGRMMELKPQLNLCNYHHPWANMTTKQKKGFKLLYHKGCGSCKVIPCPWWNSWCKKPAETACAWDTLLEGKFDCQGLESVCMKQSSGKCGWNRSIKFRHCLKLRKEHKQRQRELEP